MARKCKISGVNIDLNVCLYWPDFLAPPLKNGLRGPCRPSIRTSDETCLSFCILFNNIKISFSVILRVNQQGAL